MVAYLDKLQQPNGLFSPCAGCEVLLGARGWLGCGGDGGDAVEHRRKIIPIGLGSCGVTN